MNRIYKTVFNKSTQTWVAVCEYARGAGCGGASSTSKSVARDVCGSITFLSFAVLMALQLAHAGTPTTIIADPSAPKSLQPIILPTASGITSVNIATPNDKGLSNNHYSQFDVGSTGAVLNNNRKATNTQIAGHVAANPFMARGEASTILNQINSNNPSYLNGFVEVAGKKADVIIANPNGLIVNGAGFINAGNVHLAAANAQVKQGQLSAYQVGNGDTGNIQVNGKLNLQNTDYAALIAKTAQINEEIYAGNQLDVVLGENQVNLQNGDFTKLNATNKQTHVSSASQTTNKEQQGVALDIAALGGMYAGKIHLIGTDKGFGVNNQGVITATGSGQQLGTGTLTLDSKGNLVNTGTMSTKDKLAINTHGNTIQNNGTLLSEQADIAISTKELVNIGTIHSTQITNMNADKSIDNQGGIYGGVLQISADKLTNTGNFIQTGTGKLNISTDHLNNTNKAIIGQSLYGQTTIPTPSAPSSFQSAGTIGIGNQPINNTATTHSNNSTNTPHSSSNTSSTDGFMNVAKSLNNTGDKALITGAGNISITANKTHNTKQASIDATSLNTNTLVNTDSKIALDDIHWQLSRFDNSKGSITAKDGMVIDSGSNIINTGGSLTSGGDMTLIAKDRIINQDGTITAVKQADITAQELQNAGTITADTLNIAQETDYIHTNQDKLIANHLTLTTDGKLINQSQLIAHQNLTLHANHIDNTQAGTISSGHQTQISSQTDITNQGLINGENTRIKATNTINNQAFGRIYGTHLAIQADTLNNTPSKITNPQTNQENTQHTAPVIAAKERLDIGVNTLNNNPNPDRAGKFNENFDNQALITSLGSLHIGGSLDDNHHATGKAQTVVNKGATIESGRQMQIATNTLLNTNADFKKHTVKVEAESVYGQTLYRAHEQAAAIPTAQKSTDVTDLGNKPMAGLFDCPEGSDCIINYDNDSAIWSHFKIEPPKQPVPNIKAKDLLDEPDLPKGETTQSCALAGANNQACAQYNKDLANYTKVMGPLLKWEEDNAAAIEALELAIREYNRQFATNKSDVDLALNIYTTDEAYLGPTSKKGAPDGALYVKDANGNFYRLTEEVDVITTDFVVYEDKTLASDPARMVAGGDLIIHGNTLINDKSQMNAGAGFAVKGDTIIQTPDNGLYGEKTKVTENGHFTRYTVRSSAAGRRHKRVPNGSGSFVQSFAPLATYQLPTLNATINTTPSNISIDKTIAGDKPSSVIIDVNGHDDTISLPNSALYIINADDPNLPLVQTDPAFTNYKQWLSSDYMLKALQSDPNHIHKRLSDGYGEQARIKDQYYLLTGRHINTDYRSQEEAFKALMDNGVTHAKAFGYTLGTALSPEQMASLTTDIVWLVKQPMTYTTKDKDGNTITKTQDVLVPKLYLRSANIATGTLTKDGRYSGITGKNIDLQLAGHLDNNGNLIAKDAASIKANNATNKGVIQGDFVAVTTSHDLTNQGTMYANSAMSLDAGNNLTNQSQTITQTNTQGKSSSSRTDISRIATISVGAGLKDKTDDNGKPLTTLNIQSGNYILNQGATSDNAGGSTQMTAKNGINITTITTSNHINAVADENNYFKYNQTTDVGSNITSHGNLTIATTGKEADINIKGSRLDSATGTTAVIGTGDVRMSEGRQTQSIQSAISYQEDKWYGSKDIKQTHEYSTDTAVLNAITGNKVHLSSQNANVSLYGTNITANEQASIHADQGRATIESAKDKTYHNTTRTTQNFYKNTGGIDGSYQETLNQTGIYAGSIDIQGKSADINAVKLQVSNGPMIIGNAHLATNEDGALQLDENGKPTVLSGDMAHLNFGTVDLRSETWQESSKSYRGLAKDVMKGVGVVAGALGFDGVTLAKSDSNHSKTEIQAVSELHGSHIQAGAQTVTATGTRFDAGKDGFVAVLGDDVLFATAKHVQTANVTQARQTITGEGMKLGRDHLQLGAVVYTDGTDTQSTQSTTHDGVTVRGNNAVVLGNMNDGSLTTQATNFDLDPTSGTLLIGAKSTLLDGAINQTAHTQSNETNTTRIGATVHHVAVDTAIAAENVKEAIQAANHARKELEQAKEMVKAGKLDPNAIKDYELNLAMATANVANAQIALGSAAATAASTAPTLGFSAKLGATHTQSQSSQTQTNQDFVATHITAANTTFIGDDFAAKGLQGAIGKLNIDNLNKLTLTHGTTTNTTQNQSSTSTIDASISTTGSVSAGASKQQSRSQSTSTTTHDTKLNLGELNGHANTTTLNGATITTQGGHYSTNTLNITTSQNRHSQKENSKGGNIGIGVNNLNLGYNQQKGNSDVTTNNAPSGITYVNADANHGSSHSLTANTTTLTGGVITAVNQDKEGNVTNSNLNFTTQTLTTNDLVAKEHSQTRGINASVGTAAKGDDAKLSSVGLGLTKDGHQKETKALATVGQGATITGTITHNGQAQASTDLTQTDINTDALNTQQVIKDQKTGGLNFDTTLDTRIFTKEGRGEIKKEQERLDENLKATGKITGAAGVQVVATTANVLTGNQTLTQAIQGAKAPAKMAKAIQDNPELAAILDAYQKGEYHNLTLSQEALQALSDATGISTKVLLTSITAQRGIQGATNKTLTVIDTHDELRADSIQTLGHELDHIRGGKNETLADLAGLAAKLNTDAAIIANQDNINPIKAQLGDGKDAQTTLQNQALLEGNDKTFVENHDGREGEWSYDHDRLLPDGSYGHPGDRVTFTNEEALIIKDLIGAVVVPIGFADAYYNAKTDEEKAMAIATAFKIPISRARIYAQQAKQHSRSKSQNIGVNNSSYSSDFHKSISGRQTDYIINQQASKRVHLVTAPIDFDGHILSAEIKRNGTVVGGHSTANGNIRVDSVVKTYSNGVYEAKISVKDPNNPNNYLPKSNNNGISTMFPNSWSADRVKVEVDYAYQNRKVVTNSRGQQMWEGITPSGVKVTGYLQPKVTVYPVK